MTCTGATAIGITVALSAGVGGIGSALAGSADAGIRDSNASVLVLRLLGPQVGTAKAHGLPVLLPRRIRPGVRPVHGEGSASNSGYTFTIAGGPASSHCGGANACTILIFDAVPAHPLVGTTVALSRGRVGAYTPMSCGASCSDPSLSWNERGFTYTISGAIGTPHHMRIPLVQAANRAIIAGPR